MKRNFRTAIIALAAAVMAPLCAQARVLSPEEALSRATRQIESSDGGSRSSRRLLKAMTDARPTCVYSMTTTIDAVQAPALYVFNSADGNSFIIAGGDDRVAPVLAVSDEGGFSTDNIPPQLEWWLGEYARQIEYTLGKPQGTVFNIVRRDQEEPAPEIDVQYTIARSQHPRRASKRAIEPMVTSKWNQTSPFNDKCPLISGRRSVTGCVATAMAQVMNFHKWPVKGTGSHSYKTESNNTTVSFDFGATTFDWDNMLNTYGSFAPAESKEAVATLMLSAGVSVDTDYTPDESGASSGQISHGLEDYLGYSDKTTFYGRSGMTDEAWNELVYEALEQGYPLIYSGVGSAGGHEFVCDGYNSSGLFHMNWGWGGSSDGYFKLEALNPSSLGTGGGAGGFNYMQDIVVAVRPDQSGFTPSGDIQTVELYCTQYELGKGGNDRFSFDIINNTDKTQKFAVNYKVVDDKLSTVFDNELWNDVELPTGSYLEASFGIQKIINGLKEGTYYMYMTYRLEGTSEFKQLPVLEGGNSCKITKKGNQATLGLEDVPGGSDPQPAPDPTPGPDPIVEEPEMRFMGFEPTVIVSDVPCDMTFTVANEGSGDFSGPVLALIGDIDGNHVMVYEIVTVASEGNVPAGQTVEYKVEYTCSKLPTGAHIVVLGTGEGDNLALLDNYSIYDVRVVEAVGAVAFNSSLPTVAQTGETVEVPSGAITITYTSGKDLSFLPEFQLVKAPSVVVNQQLDDIILHATGKEGATVAVPAFSFTAPAEEGDYTVQFNTPYFSQAFSKLTVNKKTEEPVEETLTGITVEIDRTELRAGESESINVSPVPSTIEGVTCSFKSLSESLEVDNGGAVTVADHPTLGEATVEIEAKGPDGTVVSSSLQFTIIATEVERITIAAGETTLAAPGTLQLEAIIEPVLATDPSVDWSVEYPGLAIDEDGLLSAADTAGDGTATVTATATDGSGVSASIDIKVEIVDGISAATSDGISVRVVDGHAFVTAPAGSTVRIFDASGRLFLSENMADGAMVFEPAAQGVYIIVVGNRAFSVVL